MTNLQPKPIRSAAPLLTRFAVTLFLGLSGLLFALSTPGCVIIQTGVTNPMVGLSTVAIAPFFNLSDERAVDGRRFAAAYFAELQATHGFEVVPIGVTEQIIIAHQLQMANPQDVLKLAELLDVDAVVVGAVTDYAPYYPPRVGLQVSWYSRKPWEFSPGIQTDMQARRQLKKMRKHERGDNLAFSGDSPAVVSRAGRHITVDWNHNELPVVRAQSDDQLETETDGSVAVEAPQPLRYRGNPPEKQLSSAVSEYLSKRVRGTPFWALDQTDEDKQLSAGLSHEQPVDAERPTIESSSENTSAEVPVADVSPSIDVSENDVQYVSDAEWVADVDAEVPSAVAANRTPKIEADFDSDSNADAETNGVVEGEVATDVATTVDEAPLAEPANVVSEQAEATATLSAQSADLSGQETTDSQTDVTPVADVIWDLLQKPALIEPPQSIPLTPEPAAIPMQEARAAKLSATLESAVPCPDCPPADSGMEFGPIDAGQTMMTEMMTEQWNPLEPFMSYTRIFDGTDANLVANLRDYVELSGDQRSGGWKGYLQRSEDFIRFTSHLMITEMLTLHGGEGKRRIVLKFRKYK